LGGDSITSRELVKPHGWVRELVKPTDVRELVKPTDKGIPQRACKANWARELVKPPGESESL
jgi:hypothetical protein